MNNQKPQLKFTPVDSQYITCDVCGKSLKKKRFQKNLNQEYATTCKKCFDTLLAQYDILKLLEFLDPEDTIDENDFLRNHSDFNTDNLMNLKEQDLILYNFETGISSLASEKIIKDFLKKHKLKLYETRF